MARKASSLTEVLRFMRFSVVESAAATYTEQSFDTQLSIDRGMIWLIHFIEFGNLNLSLLEDPAQDAMEYMSCQIVRESKSAIIGLDDSDLVEAITVEKDRTATIGTDAGPIILASTTPIKINYSPPMGYAGQNIIVGVIASAGAAKTVKGRVGYTLKKVNDRQFLSLAHALIS